MWIDLNKDTWTYILFSSFSIFSLYTFFWFASSNSKYIIKIYFILFYMIQMSYILLYKMTSKYDSTFIEPCGIQGVKNIWRWVSADLSFSVNKVLHAPDCSEPVGVVAHACNPGILESWGRKVTSEVC